MLFIAGMSPKSSDAVDNLRKICDKYLDDNYELRIIDITLDKHLAVDYQIIGIPTLIKTHPGAPRTILGDLSDTEKVLKILDIE
ncbi:MAG: circadian clock protein KaiB [Flavobacterium sp.]|nr:circadian clock protein KaiB [Flavobacterium sp.]